ncbi:MAG: DUF3108 domain-containing protein [Deltaproteobacteria bacterium]|nr:DUF3108 domain-containing protein [Deltaproteobacteria bacterium]
MTLKRLTELSACSLFVFTVFLYTPDVSESGETTPDSSLNIPYGVIDPDLLAVGYPERELLEYDVSWSGGIKIGQLHLEIKKIKDERDSFEIKASISTKGGAINLIYPVHDTHVTNVTGGKRLPYRYEVWQKEGYSYEAHRVTEYNQETGEIKRWKNEKPRGGNQVDGEVNNEFSSFFNSRLMALRVGEKIVVPTFADKRRVEVVVNTVAEKTVENTILGSVKTLEVMPIMNFKGLYDKKGDTVIWYTADECRVPVLINSKIVIGSLTAKLAAYENSACTRYPDVVRRKK